MLPFYEQGKVFTRLTVISKAESIDNCVAYLCRCSCGNTKTVKATDLNILDCLLFFGRATVVHGEFMQPRPNAILRCLDFLLYFRPVGFEQCGRVEFLTPYFVLISMVTSHSPTNLCKNYLRNSIGRSIGNECTLTYALFCKAQRSKQFPVSPIFVSLAFFPPPFSRECVFEESGAPRREVPPAGHTRVLPARQSLQQLPFTSTCVDLRSEDSRKPCTVRSQP